ncbi:MAG: peptidylprolyl isomerase, partial [Planctomycetota bacterium]
AVGEREQTTATIDELDPVLATVGGRPVLASELLSSLLQRDALGVRSSLNVLISGKLAQLEATRMGMRLAPPLVQEATERHLDQLRQRLVGPDGLEEDLDAFLRDRLDLDPVRYRQRLQSDTIRELMTERTVRAWTLSNEYARVRLVLLATADEARLVLGEYERGADLAELASRHSIDASGDLGGLVPFMVRNDRAPLSRLAFDLEPGEIGGPIEVAGAFVLMRVEARPEPLEGTWDEVALGVEDSLLDEPVADEEWLVWQLAMERLYGIDTAPFYEFVGEPYR